jgi:hypothetical protein
MAQQTTTENFGTDFHHVKTFSSFASQEMIHRVHVTDTTPHLVWTNDLQFVILELMPDGTLVIFTRRNDIIKVTPEQYSERDFDFLNYLVDEFASQMTYPHSASRKPDEIGPNTGFTHPDAFNPLDIVEEFTYSIHKISYGCPPKQIVRLPFALPSNDQIYTFWNFEIPNKEFYDCWYHSSNKWEPNYAPMFFSLFKQCDIHLSQSDSAFPMGPVPIRLPIPHVCGINTHLVNPEVDQTSFPRSCPQWDSELPIPKLNAAKPVKPAKACNIYFTYVSEMFHSEFHEHELHSFMLDVIAVRNRVWNTQYHRCRLDHDNKLSGFWTLHPIRDRMVWLMNKPEPAVVPQHIAQLKESQSHVSVCIRGPSTWFADKGLSFIANVFDTEPGDPRHLDLSTITTLPFKYVDNMDARNRGFVSYYDHYHYIVFKNTIAINLYCIGNKNKNIYIDVFTDGTSITHAWRRFRQVIRPTMRDHVHDLRPTLLSLEGTRLDHEFIPYTRIPVRRVVKPLPANCHAWTPIIIPCHKTQCRPPNSYYKELPRMSADKNTPVYGFKRQYTISNSYFNGFIKHKLAAICTVTYQTNWKVAKDGPVTFLVCGSLVDEYNKVDFNLISGRPPVPDPDISFVTFSPRKDLSGFSLSSIRYVLPGIEEVTELETADQVKPPTWTCGLACQVPEELQNLKITSTESFRHWTLQICLNAHKLRYMPNEDLHFPCTMNPHATWRQILDSEHKAFFCSNFAFLGLNYHLPMGHPMRWTTAYQFLDSELDQMPWTSVGRTQVYSLRDITIERPYKGAPIYKVTRNCDKQSCMFSLKRFGIGEPMLDGKYNIPVIYDDEFEADTNLMGKLLEFKGQPWLDPEPLQQLASLMVSLPTNSQQTINKIITKACANQVLDPKSQAFKEISDQVAEHLALSMDSLALSEGGVLDPVLNLVKPDSSTDPLQNLDLTRTQTDRWKTKHFKQFFHPKH